MYKYMLFYVITARQCAQLQRRPVAEYYSVDAAAATLYSVMKNRCAVKIVFPKLINLFVFVCE